MSDAKKGNIGDKEAEKTTSFLTWLGVGIAIVVVLLMILWVVEIWVMSKHGFTYPDYMSHIIAFGTMLFTALYACAFISLQGAINRNTEAQENKNKEQQKERILMVLGMTIENCLNRSLEIVQSFSKNEKMTIEQYNTLINLDFQIKGYVSQLEKMNESEKLDDNLFTRFLQTSIQYREDLDRLKHIGKTGSDIDVLVKQLLQMTNIQKSINFQIATKLL